HVAGRRCPAPQMRRRVSTSVRSGPCARRAARFGRWPLLNGKQLRLGMTAAAVAGLIPAGPADTPAFAAPAPAAAPAAGSLTAPVPLRGGSGRDRQGPLRTVHAAGA